MQVLLYEKTKHFFLKKQKQIKRPYLTKAYVYLLLTKSSKSNNKKVADFFVSIVLILYRLTYFCVLTPPSTEIQQGVLMKVQKF